MTTCQNANTSLEVICSHTHRVLNNVANYVCVRLPEYDNTWCNANEFSVRSEVDTIDAGHTKVNAVLVNMQDTEVPRDNTKPCTFGYAIW